MSNLDCAYQTLPLGNNDRSRFSAALGESYISMTFGSPLATNVEHHLTWPLYLLTEMGCVYVIHSKLWSSNQ